MTTKEKERATKAPWVGDGYGELGRAPSMRLLSSARERLLVTFSGQSRLTRPSRATLAAVW
jgi:hypothetical protein